MTPKTLIFLRARRKNNGTPDRQEETHKKYIIHFTEIQFSPVLPSSAQFCPVFPSFIQFSSVLLSFSSNFTQFRPVSPSFAQFCPVLPSFLQFYPIFISFAEFSSNLIQFQPTPSFAQFCPVLSNFVQFSQVSLRNFVTFFPNNFGFLFLHQCLSLYSVLHFVLLNFFFLHNFARFLPRNFSFLFLRLFSLMFRAQLPHDIKSFFGLKFKPKKESNYEIIFYSRCSNVTQCCTSI